MAHRSNGHPRFLIALPAALPLLLALLLLAIAFAPATAQAAPELERVGDPAGAVRGYWTDARLRAAEPIDGPDPAPAPQRAPAPAGDAEPTFVPAAGAALLRAGSPARPERGILLGLHEEVADPAAPEFSPHGKVFFTIPSGEEAGDYVCSGTAVNSRNRSVVWTAGHCVFPETGGGFVANWTFVPAYDQGEQPYGQWPAKRLATTGPWQETSNIKYDLGAAVVRRNTEGRRLQELVGAKGIGFDQPRDHLYHAYGYPAVPAPTGLDFDGEREFRCSSRHRGDDEPGTSGPPTMYIDCDMTAGSSGGGWIAGTTLLSVTSYGYAFDLDRLYGPYMSRSAKALYRGIAGKKKKKKPKGKGGQGGKQGK